MADLRFWARSSVKAEIARERSADADALETSGLEPSYTFEREKSKRFNRSRPSGSFVQSLVSLVAFTKRVE
jgi:hypothetical protein